jgi:hypothetical protein
MESLAAAYGWSPATIADLTLDELELWATTAEARLKSRPTCPWLTRD